jgi:hypothetical protein
MADELTKLDRESLLNIARSPVPKQRISLLNVLNLLLIMFMVPLVVNLGFDALQGLLGWTKTTNSEETFTWIAAIALLIAINGNKSIEHSQKQIQALTELLNREGGK